MSVRRTSRLQPTDVAWNASVEQMLRTIDVRLSGAVGDCRDMLEDLRADVALLIRSEIPRAADEVIH